MKNRKKVLADGFLVVNELTGLRTYTLEFCKGTVSCRENLQNVYIVPCLSYFQRINFLKGRLKLFQKIVFHSSYFLWKQFALPLLALFYRTDTIVTIDYIAPFLSFGRRKFTVFHDTVFWEYPEHYNTFWLSYTRKMIKWGLTGRCVIVASSQYTKKQVRQHLAPENIIETVYQCAQELIPTNEKKILRQLALIPGSYFLHVGYFDKRKDLPILIKAFGLFSEKYASMNIKLVLAGMRGYANDMDNYKQIIETIETKSLGQHVCLPGYVHKEDLGDLYENCFAYVFPSRNEGFGIPLVETMSFGRPAVISDQGALQEVAGGAALTFKAGDIHDLFRKTEALLDPDLYKKLSEAGKVRAKRFSREQFVERFDAIISQYD